MMVVNERIGIRSSARVELLNITNKVEELLKRSRIENGVITLYTRHTTSALIINENEERLKKDIQNMLEKIVPAHAGYRHDEIDDNADAHLRSTLLQPFLIIPVVGGRIQLGTWQSIFFLELDGPRGREVVASIIGE